MLLTHIAKSQWKMYRTHGNAPFVKQSKCRALKVKDWPLQISTPATLRSVNSSSRYVNLKMSPAAQPYAVPVRKLYIQYQASLSSSVFCAILQMVQVASVHIFRKSWCIAHHQEQNENFFGLRFAFAAIAQNTSRASTVASGPSALTKRVRIA